MRELIGEESRKGFTKQNISIPDMPQVNAQPVAKSTLELHNVIANMQHTKTLHTQTTTPPLVAQRHCSPVSNMLFNNSAHNIEQNTILPSAPSHVDTNTHLSEMHPESAVEELMHPEGAEDEMALFVEFVSSNPTTPKLHTPPRVNDTHSNEMPNSSTQPSQQRKSNRLAEKAKANPITRSIQLAQCVLMNKLGELSPRVLRNANGEFEQKARHLPRPLTKMKMEALKMAIKQGNKLMGKKKAKVALALAGVQA